MAREESSETGQAIPSRYRYMAGILDALRALGGKAASSEVYKWLIDQGRAYPSDLTTIQRDGGTRFRKEVRWARKELYDAEYIDSSDYGVWALTSSGADLILTADLAKRIVSGRAIARRKMKFRPPATLLEAANDSPLDILGAGPSTPTTGPIPGDWSAVVSRTTSKNAWTYMARYGLRDMWKIGHTSDLKDRLDDLNKHIPVEILGESWRFILVQPWPDTLSAYAMEQAVLSALRSHRTLGERVACDKGTIFETWNRFLA